jgi:class 3 adenylate cyclase/tetratricopeptide (TPR) repeat protein
MRCPACDAVQAEPGLDYCTSCGAELGRPAVAVERKVVSVLFVDLVGFTSLAETLDPEVVRAVLDRYSTRVRDELERYGGTVEKFIGDAVMALFGAPAAHEDDAVRAVRAACAVREAVGELRADEGSSELHIRAGVTSGEVVVALGARPEEGEAMAHGDVVNTAARLQAGAPVDGILVDERTYRATRFEIEFRQSPPLHAKGKREPVPVWEVIAPRGRADVDRLRHARPLVGRDRELQVMTETLAAVVARREPALLTLVGPPGIGKSRMLWELFQHIDREPELIFWRRGRSLPYGDGVTFWALAEIVKAHAGVLATDSAGTVREKLRIAVEDVIRDGVEAGWVAGHLAPLAGLTPEHELRGDHRAEAFAAWRRFLEAVADRSPLVLVFEDLHWADDGLLDFVSTHLGDRFRGPLLVLATCRPELLERRSGWGSGGPGSATLRLEPLSDDDTARLVSDLLDAQLLPDELRSALVASAGGNPLYAEEYVRMLLDRGLLRRVGTSWELARTDLPLPESLHAIVAARLDSLRPEEKTLLHDASVVGKSFWLGALSAVGGRARWSAEDLLYDLERKQLVRRERDSIVRSEPEFSFFHVIVRDVAYGQIPRSLRAEKHRRAAEWFQSLSIDRSEDRSEMLAHHYLSALRYAESTGEGSESLVEPARLALRDVGDRAHSLNAFTQAAQFYGEALALWPPQAPGRDELLFRLGRARVHAESGGADLLAEARDAFLADGRTERAAEATVLIGELLWMQGRRAFAHFEQAAALLDEAPPSREKAYVLSSLARFLMIEGENEEAIRVGLEAVKMADALSIAELRAHALDSIGLARARSGDERGFGDLEESIAIAVGINSLESVRGYANLGSALVEAGELERAFELYEEGRTRARGFGDAERIRWFDAERLYEWYWRGLWDEAGALADRIVEQVEGGSPNAIEMDARLLRSRIRLARDDEPGSLEDSARALDLGRQAGYPEMLIPAMALHARVLESTGRAGEARSLAEELLTLWPGSCPTSYWLADLAFTLDALDGSERLLEAVAALGASSRWLTAARAVASGDFPQAAALYAGIGSLPDEAHAGLRAAGQLVDAGRREQAETALESALAVLRRLGATRYVREGETLLGARA